MDSNTIFIIKSLIVTRTKTGATIPQIKDDFAETEGTFLNMTDYLLAEQLNNLVGVTFKRINNENYYFFRSQESEHISKMIEQQKQPPKKPWHCKQGAKQARTKWVGQKNKVLKRSDTVMNSSGWRSTGAASSTNPSYQSSFPIHFGENSLKGVKTPTSSHNNPIKNSIDKIKHRLVYQSNCVNATPVDPNIGHSSIHNCFGERDSNVEAIAQEFNRMHVNTRRNNCYQEQYLTPNHKRPYSKQKMPKPKREQVPPFTYFKHNSYFANCELIGDDFFLSLFENELQHIYVPDTQDLQIGSCIAGQTILEAANNVWKRQQFDKDVIINVGSVDLLNEHGFKKMKHNFRKLITALESNGVYDPAVTTLAPLVNKSMGSFIWNNEEKFNEFLLENYSNVIDLKSAMMNYHDEPDFMLYAPRREYSKLFDNGMVKWNWKGRTRILHTIEDYFNVNDLDEDDSYESDFESTEYYSFDNGNEWDFYNYSNSYSYYNYGDNYR